MITFLLVGWLVGSTVAQVSTSTSLVIEDIDRTSGTVDEIVTIQGRGFGNDSLNILVFFGTAMADSVVSVQDTEIKVQVPAGATVGSISVTDTARHLTAYSSDIFTLSYDGNTFAENQLEKYVLDDAAAAPDTIGSLYNLCFCDFNLDGRSDIAVSDAANSAVTIFRNETSDIGSVAFSATSAQVGARTRWVRCGDLNGDGLADLVFSASNNNASDKEKIYVLRNISVLQGEIKFEAPALSYAVRGSQSGRMDIRDLDGDGLAEIAATDLSNSGIVSVFKNTSTPGQAISFMAEPFEVKTSAPVALSSIDLEDMNGDGLTDLLVGESGGTGIYVFTNNSTPGSFSFSSPLLLNAPGFMSNIKVADVNHDRKPDIVISNTDLSGSNNNTYVGVFKNTATAQELSFADVVRFDQVSRLREGLDIADMDGNGKPDILIGNRANNVVILLNQSTETNLDFTARKVLALDAENLSVRAGDLNGDGIPDIAYTDVTNHHVVVYLNRNCVVPVLEPQNGLGVCDVFPYQLTVTRQAVNASYQWERSDDGISFAPVSDGADSTVSYTVTDATKGFYRVQLSSGSATCSQTSNVVEVKQPDGFVPSKPEINNKNPATPVCFGETIFLSAKSVNASYFWEFPDGTISNEQNPVIPNATAADEGLYVLYVQAGEDQGGCRSDTATTYIRVSEPPAIEVQNVSTPVFFEGSKRTLKVEKISDHTYAWKKDGSFVADADDPELEVSEPGSYVAVIQNALGCTRESPPYALAFAQPLISEEVCRNENLSFQITPEMLAGQSVRYRWSFGDGTPPVSGTSVTHAYGAAGTFAVTVEILDTSNNIADTYSQEVSVLDLPALTLTAENNRYLCPGESMEIAANEGFASYVWNTGETTPNITVEQPGSYMLTVTASSGCVNTQTIEILDGGSPDTTIQARADRIALGDTLRLTARAEALTYAWSPASSLSDSTAQNPLARPLVTTTYTCLITNAQNCQTTASFMVTVDRSLDVIPQKAFTPNDDGKNDQWYIEKMELYPDCRMTLFNRQGIKLLEIEDYSNANGWNGYIKGKPAPKGVYFYQIDCGKEAGSQTGSVTIVR